MLKQAVYEDDDIRFHLAVSSILIVFLSWLPLQLREVSYKRAREEIKRNRGLVHLRRKLRIATGEFTRCREILMKLQGRFYEDAAPIEFDEPRD